MDKHTQTKALAMLAKAAAEIAADIASHASEAAGHASKAAELEQNPYMAANVIVGAILPAEKAVAELADIFRAMHALHLTRSI